MPHLLGFQSSVPASWTAGEPAGSAGHRVGHTTPIHDPDAMPGTYFHPGASPYTVALPGGLEVQEAYKGQYYVPNPGMTGFGMAPLFPYNPIICAIVGALAGAGAGFGVAKAMKKKPQFAGMGAAGGAVVGGIIGYLICGKKKLVPAAPGGRPTPNGAFAPPNGAFAPPNGALAPPNGAFAPPNGAFAPPNGAPPDDPFAPPEMTLADRTFQAGMALRCPPGLEPAGGRCRPICPPAAAPHLSFWDGTKCVAPTLN